MAWWNCRTACFWPCVSPAWRRWPSDAALRWLSRFGRQLAGRPGKRCMRVQGERFDLSDTPAVSEFVDFQDEEGLGGDDPVDVVHAFIDEVGKVLGVATDDLSHDVVLPGRHYHVGGLGEFSKPLADLARGSRPHFEADHREAIEADGQRIGDTDDLEDAVLLQAVHSVAYGGGRDAKVLRYLAVGPTAVGLEDRDDAPVSVVERVILLSHDAAQVLSVLRGP